MDSGNYKDIFSAEPEMAGKFKNINIKDVKEGYKVVIKYGWLFNTKKLAVAYAEKSKSFETTGHSLLGLSF